MLSSNVKYIGLDVHKEAIAIAVLNGAGKLVMESIHVSDMRLIVHVSDTIR